MLNKSSVQEIAGGMRYRADFRAEAVQQVVQWLGGRQKSGLIVGLAGAGKSNFVQFICEEVVQVHNLLPAPLPPVLLVPIDLNNLVDLSLGTLYRVILRAFYYHRAYFPKPLLESVVHQYEAVRVEQDPFVAQSALYELLFAIRDGGWRVVLILDRFDAFTEQTTPELMNTLRAFRDAFKQTLSYFLVMRQEVLYLPDMVAMGEMVELVDTHVCWIGAMSVSDARYFIDRETRFAQCVLSVEDVDMMLALSGRFASLLKCVCAWWLELCTEKRPSPELWLSLLKEYHPVQYRLTEIWQGLNQEERYLLMRLQLGRMVKYLEDCDLLLHKMAAKGVVVLEDGEWEVSGRLLAQFVENVTGTKLGRIWKDEKMGLVYCGEEELDGLRPLERAMLDFLLANPHRQHSKSDLIENIWPDDVQRDGVTDDSLYQVVRGLRKKIEPEPSLPTYIISRRGWPESGYQFYPEGQPN